MSNKAYTASVNEVGGGRILLLLLLFALAIYQFIQAGFNAFAIICMLPVVALLVICSFRYHMFVFWVLVGINYFVQWKNMPLPQGIPMSLYNEALEMLLLALAIIDVKEARFSRAANLMLFAH